jgi:hypothetical protein
VSGILGPANVAFKQLALATAHMVHAQDRRNYALDLERAPSRPTSNRPKMNAQTITFSKRLSTLDALPEVHVFDSGVKGPGTVTEMPSKIATPCRLFDS